MKLLALKTLAVLNRAAFLLDPILPYLVADWRYTVLFAVWSVAGWVHAADEEH